MIYVHVARRRVWKREKKLCDSSYKRVTRKNAALMLHHSVLVQQKLASPIFLSVVSGQLGANDTADR